MASGFVLVYLGIAALVAPVAWVLWWGLDAFATRPAPAHSPARPRLDRPVRLQAPHAVDASFAGRRDRVTVYSGAGEELATCPGPGPDGRCSRPLADGTVPCAGCVLALPRPIRGSLEWQIPNGYRTCLLGSYAVLRQPAAAR